MNDGMIVADNLTKHFGSFAALDHASLHVPQGSVYGLVGPNGAGKSTVLRHVMGIYRPDEGDVLIDGEPVWDNAVLKQRVSFIPDELFYYPNASVLDMKTFYQQLYEKFDINRFNSLGDVFSTIGQKQIIRKMSKGMQKQALFWLTMSCHPDVLLLDEPVDGLDPVMRRQVWGVLMADVAEHGTTILVSSHNLRELEDVCDHIGIMHKGKVLLERSLDDLEGSVSKIQVAFADEMPLLPASLNVIHQESQGSVHLLIIRGDREQVMRDLEALHPLVIDVLPLTLEEIFIYEMGGVDYEVKDILV